MSAKPFAFAACGLLAAALFVVALIASSPTALADRQYTTAQAPRLDSLGKTLAPRAEKIGPNVPPGIEGVDGIGAGAPMTTPTPLITPSRTPTPGVSPTYTPSCGGPSQWSNEPSITFPRAYGAGVATNDGTGNKFYVISGSDGTQNLYTSSVERYDPATNTWTDMAPIPTPGAGMRGAALGPKIYVPGGYNANYGGAMPRMQIFYTNSNDWTICPNWMPEAVASAAVVSYNSKIYIIGGTLTSGSATAHVWEHDPYANTYTAKADLPIAESYLGAVEMGGLIYVFGGFSHYLSYVFDPAANTWTPLSPGPTPNFASPGVFVLNGQIWVVGGSNEYNQPYPPNQQVHIYNPIANNWYLGPPLNNSRMASSAAGAVDGRGYIAGGRTGSGAYMGSVESVSYLPCVTGTPTPTPATTRTPTPLPTSVPDLVGLTSWTFNCPTAVLNLTTWCRNCINPYRATGPSHMRVQNNVGSYYDFPVPGLNYQNQQYTYPCAVGNCIPESFFSSFPVTLTVDIFNEVFEYDETNNTTPVPQGPPATPTACPTYSATPSPTPTRTLPDLTSQSGWLSTCPLSELHLQTVCINCHQYPPNVTAGPSHMRIQNSIGQYYDFPVPELNYYAHLYDYPCPVGSCIPESFFTSYPITLTADIFNEVPEVEENNNTSWVPQGPPPTPTVCPTGSVTPSPTPTGTLPDLMSQANWLSSCSPVLNLRTLCTNCQWIRPAGPSHMRVQNSIGQYYDFPVPQLTYPPYYDYPCPVGSCIPESFFASYPITLTADIFNEVPESNEGNNTIPVPQGPPPTPTACPTSSPTPTPPPPNCGPAWRVVPYNYGGIFFGVKAISANDVWAVGNNGAIHWDGSSWSPVSATAGLYLNGVSALASNDVWLSGGGGVYHWNGTSLAQSYQVAQGESLYSIAEITADDVWAVGMISAYPFPAAHAIHWNGTQWAQADPPHYGTSSSLLSVAGVDAGRVWAVGAYAAPSNFPLILQWDGSQWLNQSTAFGGLTGVTAVSPSDAWAVGGSGLNMAQSLIVRYTVGGWQQMQSPDIGRLSGVSATSATDIWAVGPSGILHSDGSTWVEVASPPSTLHAVSGVAADDVWAVGETPALILHYSRDLFWDVPPSNTFYQYVQCLACRGLVSGYSDGTFRPYNNITRGQISKVVSNAANFNDDVTGRQTYTDVPPSNTFWLWVERLTLHGVMSGYPCGGPNEPCDPQNRPYFRWANNATRAQLAKIDSNAAGYSETPTTQTFADVPPSNPFYLWVERLASRGIMGGYPCGGVGEPCDPQNRPYFRWANNITRGQAAKIVANTFYPNCQWR